MYTLELSLCVSCRDVTTTSQVPGLFPVPPKTADDDDCFTDVLNWILGRNLSSCFPTLNKKFWWVNFRTSRWKITLTDGNSAKEMSPQQDLPWATFRLVHCWEALRWSPEKWDAEIIGFKLGELFDYDLPRLMQLAMIWISFVFVGSHSVI